MDIENYPNYKIYEDGRIWSKSRNIFKKAGMNKDGYLRVTLSHNNKHNSYFIHRLLAQHFIPNPDNKPEVDHIDRNKLNNSLENLRWVNRIENVNNANIVGILNEKFITYSKIYNKFIFQINRQSVTQYKRFEFLNDAIIYRDIFCFENDINID